MRALLLLSPLLLLGAAPAGDAAVVLDSLDTVAAWRGKASDGVTGAVSAIPGHDGGALRLTWDFNGFAGYAVARHDVALVLPDNYAISFWLRWRGGTNNLELKLVDAGGENVWWYSRPDIALKPGWQKITVRKRDIAFAWGPTADKLLRRAASIEFVVSHGRDGGKGTLDIDDIRLDALPAAPAVLPAPVANASSGEPAMAIDGDPATSWHGTGPLTIDFGAARDYGGVILHWRGGAPDYVVETSADARAWTIRRRVSNGDGEDDPVALPETEARYLRIVPAGPVRLAEVEIMPPAFGASANGFIAELARRAPRGSYPRGFTEQSYWTLIGTDGGHDSALISEDGAIEVAKGAFSIEPFVTVGDRRYGWADVTATQSLAEGYLPIPSVTWTTPDWTLETRAFADASVAKGRVLARYTLTNRSARPRRAEIALAVRPFQVNPPAQFLSQTGGVSAIDAVAWSQGRLSVTGADGRRTAVIPITPPARITAAAFGTRARGPAAVDPIGLAAATLAYPVTLPAHGHATVLIAVPFPGAAPVRITPAAFDRAERATAAIWRDRLNRVALAVPPGKQALADTLRSSLAHILMSRDGPILRPATRSYARSWIRDGAMISEGLLRLGQTQAVAAYADWYSRKLFASGKVPCCVDFKGADPVPENDSQGEYIFLVTELYRFGGDRAALARHWPAVAAAARYMETQRATTQGAVPWLRGLMPPSISHEGYSARPEYSLWDDFWALRGYKDAAFAARALGKPEAATIAGQRDAFQRDLLAAIDAAARHWNIGFIPGATSLGDFDATSTTVALSPAGAQAQLDPRLLAGTFDRYWDAFRARADRREPWQDYTPYELRSVAAMVRLGHRERVDPLLDFFMADRRPAGWNQWAEVVGRDPRAVRFIGDMPHAWISSDFIRSALDMIAYQRFEDDALVLGAGLSEGYLAGRGTAVRGLRTPYGTLDFTIRSGPHGLTATIGGTARPPGGFVLPWPFASPHGAATVDGAAGRWRDDALVIAAIGRPITIEVTRP